ncbi:Hypothetical protein HVIM_03751 [Roseomonas mucosa]|uniref:Insertion element IS402-like domain-containing protein n=1 Tax=Roseomonas mucosa TaxID=207340 RepID=A0A379MWI3_9PROT|nr:Hypothetical protein HVIM_03751 [Roseomonas mucosa]QDE01807.1 Hypothetical protein ADP8_03751 [Roseomonas mucosa]UZO94092.1 Hypothetical protein RMP42_03751 [Roseomonas mucosa]SUE38614.1 Uncharacterised protein [Roseomonas mucosa]
MHGHFQLEKRQYRKICLIPPARATPSPMRATPTLPFHPLTDAEWSALSPYLPHDPRHRGRPVAEGPRARMDAIFAHALTPLPWSALPAQHGRTDTIARFFRRLTHAGVWGRLLTVLATLPAQHPLQSLRHRICRAARRAYRILGMGLILLARRLNLRSALPGPPWLLPDPDLSETLRRAKLRPCPPGAALSPPTAPCSVPSWPCTAPPPAAAASPPSCAGPGHERASRALSPAPPAATSRIPAPPPSPRCRRTEPPPIAPAGS